MKMEEFYTLILDDGGRNKSKRRMQINDCTVRSLAILSGISYDEVYDTLAQAGRITRQGFDIHGWINENFGSVLNGQFEYVHTFPRKELLTPFNFSKYFKSGRYLLGTTNHVWACIDGVHRDLWRVEQNKPLSSVWKFVPTKKRIQNVKL